MSIEGPKYWWDEEYVYNPQEDPWARPEGWQMTPERPPVPDIACGRCGGTNGEYDAAPMFHLRWECTAQEAWIEAAINDRQARPDRFRQAKRDLGAKTLSEARQLLAAMKD